MNILILSMFIFIGVLILMSILRRRLGDNFEIKNSDIMIAIIPIALWLFLTGKIQSFEFGDIKIESAFVQAAEAAITPDIRKIALPLEKLNMNPKSGVNNIPRLIENKTEALTFNLGYSGYYGPAIRKYLKELNRVSLFKYVIFLDLNNNFAGLIDSRQLHEFLEIQSRGFKQFENLLRSGNESGLLKYPGFISKEQSILRDMDKQTVLELMNQNDLEVLPVTDENGKFAGVVERAKLVSSLIVEVAQKIK